jgi:hypothetical protein
MNTGYYRELFIRWYITYVFYPIVSSRFCFTVLFVRWLLPVQTCILYFSVWKYQYGNSLVISRWFPEVNVRK